MMKLKKLPIRAYNILFHTHTVTGITITAGLFIIFFCGAFALFRHEMYTWENQNARENHLNSPSYAAILTAIEEQHPDFRASEQFTIRQPEHKIPLIQFFGAEYPNDSTRKRFKSMLDPTSLQELSGNPAPTTVGETLYRLHYFSQVPLGLWISGFMALFFLFATISGVLIHWQHIVKRFYAFSIRTTAKQIWTLGHTTIGMIGLPFQVMYAVTGALFGLLTLLLAPSAFVLFNGDTDQVLGAVAPERVATVDSSSFHLPLASLDELSGRVDEAFPDYAVMSLRVAGYGTPEGIATFYVDEEATITGNGAIAYGLAGGQELVRIDPATKTYTNTVYNFLLKLHFASYGNPLSKLVYFILAIMTCFMLVSGLLLWQKARDNARYTPRQRRFHFKVTRWMLSICMALFPAAAILFLANKIFPLSMEAHAHWVNQTFFIAWGVLIVSGIFQKTFRRLFRWFFAIGGGLSILVPIVNGVVTGDWIWDSFRNGQTYVAGIDIFWLLVGTLTLGFMLFPATQWKGSEKVLAAKPLPAEKKVEPQPAQVEKVPV